jgi:hypothetical protein
MPKLTAKMTKFQQTEEADSAEADRLSAGSQVASEMHLQLACIHSANGILSNHVASVPVCRQGVALQTKPTIE